MAEDAERREVCQELASSVVWDKNRRDVMNIDWQAEFSFSCQGYLSKVIFPCYFPRLFSQVIFPGLFTLGDESNVIYL